MNERKTLGMMAAPATTSTMLEEVSPASPMKRDRSTSPTVTASPERSPSVLRSMRTNTPTTGSPTSEYREPVSESKVLLRGNSDLPH